jgi:hypothetical protein
MLSTVVIRRENNFIHVYVDNEQELVLTQAEAEQFILGFQNGLNSFEPVKSTVTDPVKKINVVKTKTAFEHN